MTGETSTVNVARILRHMHRHLFMPVKIGVPIVTSLAFLLLVSLVTAFVVYKKWWRGFFRLPRLTSARTFLGDIHRLMGLWSAWFIALIAVTSVWYLLENVAIPAPAPPTATIDAPAMTMPQAIGELDASAAAAHAAWPGLRQTGVSFPVAGRSGFVFSGQDTALLVRPRANTVAVDPATAEVRLVSRGDDLSLHHRIAEAADPLHFGDFGGFGVRIIWFVFGLTMSGLSVTGVAVYALRLSRASPAAKPGTPHAPGAARIWWRGMGLWRWLALALVLAAFALAPFWNY